MKKIIILMIVLMLTGCTNEGASDTPVPTPTPEPIVSVEPTVTPTIEPTPTSDEVVIDEYNIYGIYQEYFEGLGLEKEYTEEYWEFPLFKDYAEYLIVPYYVCEVGDYVEMHTAHWRSCEVYNEKADSMVYNLEDLLPEGTKFQYSDLCGGYLCGLEEVEFDLKEYLSSKTWLPIPSYFHINGTKLDIDNDDPDKETFGSGVGLWQEELEIEGVTRTYSINYYPIWDETYLTITDNFEYYSENAGFSMGYYNYLYFGKLKK